MLTKYVHLIYFFLLLHPIGKAQQLKVNFESIPLRNGMSSGLVNQIFEDSQGYMWFATKDGASRFDGKEYDVFLSKKNSFHSTNCVKLIEDRNQNIWTSFFLEQGNNSSVEAGRSHFLIDKYYKIHEIDEFYKDLIPFQSKMIRNLYQHKEKVIYIVTSTSQIYKFDGQFSLIGQVDFREEIDIHSIDEMGNIFLLIDQKQFAQFSKNKKLKIIGEVENNTALHIINNDFSNPDIIPFFKQGHFHRLILFEENEEIQSFFNYPKLWNNDLNFRVHRFFNVKKGNDYFFTESGDNRLFLFDNQGELIYDFQDDIRANFDSISIQYRPLLRQNQIWFNTLNGVHILNNKPNPFKNHLKSKQYKSIRGIIELDNGELITVSNRWVYHLDINGVLKKKVEIKGAAALWDILKLSKEKLLLGSVGSEIIKFDLQSYQYEKLKLNFEDRQTHKGNGFATPFMDEDQKIWIGTFNGLLVYNQQKDSLELFTKYNEYEELKTYSINYFHESDDGIWLGTSNGLFLLDKKEGIIEKHQPLPNLEVYHFFREQDIFWLATYGNGLVKWNRQNNEIKVYDKSSDLLNNHLTAIYSDKANNLWCGSETGLVKFNKTSEASQIFLDTDGISHNEFNRSAHFKTKDGRIYLGGLNGITVFHPDSIVNSLTTDFPFVITSYKELDEESGQYIDKTSQLLEQQKIELSSSSRSISLKFSLLNYINVDKTLYQWKLEDFDKTWYSQNENLIRFNQFPYGHYVLKIRAKGYSGNWNQKEISIPISKAAPFYTQLGWQLAGLLIGIFIIGAIILWREKILQRRRKILEKAVEERTKIISEQKDSMEELNQSLNKANNIKNRLFAILGHDLKDPILAFQKINKSIKYFTKKGDTKRILELETYLEKETQYLYHLLDNLLNWALSERNELLIVTTTINLHQCVEEVIRTNEEIAKNLNVHLLNNVPLELVVFADQRVLNTVFRNLISNALRHSLNNTWIKISAIQNKEIIKISVKDNGKGISSRQIHELFKIKEQADSHEKRGKISFGLFLCKELIELIKGTISATSEEGMGTEFIISLPEGVKKLNK